jgi:hypothetical protein
MKSGENYFAAFHIITSPSLIYSTRPSGSLAAASADRIAMND